MSDSSNSKIWIAIGLLVCGIIFGVGPFKNAKKMVPQNTNYTSNQSSSISFKGSSGYHSYKCSVPGCLCKEYKKSSTYNLDCINCDHSQRDHYEFK